MLEQRKETNESLIWRLKRKGKKERIREWIRKLILNAPPQVEAYRSNGLDMYLIRWVDLESLEKVHRRRSVREGSREKVRQRSFVGEGGIINSQSE